MNWKYLLHNKHLLFLLMGVILVVFVFVIQLFMPKKISYKSKADEVITLSFDPASVTAAANTDFTVSVKITPTNPLTIQLFKVIVNFDKSKAAVKSINYSVGAPSVNLGADDASSIAGVNTAGTVKLIGEITNPATGLVVSGATELAKITFTAKAADANSVTNSASSVSKVNADFTVITVPLSNAMLSVNGGGVNPTATATGVPGNVTLNLKLKFQGIIKKPATNTMAVRVKVGTSDYSTGTFTSDDNGIWSGSIGFNLTPGANNTIYVKGPKHIQKKICAATPTESSPGSYHCANGVITLAAGANNLDFSGVYLLVGDLPEQDGVVNAYDTSLVRNNIGKSDAETLRLTDLNLDGVVDTQDFSLVIAALSVKGDEE